MDTGQYRTLKPTDQETSLEHGSGLGFWFVYWVVTAVGGEFTFAVDEGTTARVTFPLAEPAEPPALCQPSSSSPDTLPLDS